MPSGIGLARRTKLGAGGPSLTALFSDDFNRADNGSVGNGWSENEAGGGGAAEAEIVSNRLRLAGANVYRAQPAAPSVAFTMSGVFRVAGNAGQNFSCGMWADSSDTDAQMFGFRCNFNSSTVTLYKSNVALATGNLGAPVAGDTDYYFWIDFVPNGSNKDCHIYISTANSKPASPVVSALNEAIPGVTNIKIAAGGAGYSSYGYCGEVYIWDGRKLTGETV